MTERAQKVMDAFYSTFANERVDFIVQKLNNDAIANVLREVADRLCTDVGELECPIKVVREIADEVEAL